ncbi:hypothetical protein LDENG_00181950 [Lucifuga dentata]|nr:hypothetical protein LDENG_00181950 [Lucifuga dentata]
MAEVRPACPRSHWPPTTTPPYLRRSTGKYVSATSSFSLTSLPLFNFLFSGLVGKVISFRALMVPAEQ